MGADRSVDRGVDHRADNRADHCVDHGAARETLRGFVLELNPELDPAQLRDDTALISSRLVTSRDVLDLLLLIESLRQSPIDPRTLVPSAFANINSIVSVLLPSEA